MLFIDYLLNIIVSLFYATVELKKQISSALRLVNSTDNYVAFKVINSAQLLILFPLLCRKMHRMYSAM
jgi:hypothetical protein